jgi:SAM-dependent methyltransferase
MNLLHRYFCRSDSWRRVLEERVVPWVLADGSLGSKILELGPGHGLTTDLLRHRVQHLTALELDPALAHALMRRLWGSNVSVVQGDATAMPLESGQFSGAVSLHMLHHIHSPELQDRLFREVRRVLKPGAVFVGVDSLRLRRLWMRIFHLGDTLVPVDPASLQPRLEAAGFEDVCVETNPYAFRFRAQRPLANS